MPKHNDEDDKQTELCSNQRMIFITTYNLFSGFSKTHGMLKGWQNYFYNAWGVSKWTANRIVNAYYDNGFIAERKTRNDKGMTLINSEKKERLLILRCMFTSENKLIEDIGHTHLDLMLIC